ncbi:MAG: c-type cytochrome [Pseudolabrys sp.]|jgi:uncharacterized membrane protein
MILHAVAMIILATVAPAAQAGSISDAEVLVIVQKHCATCHTKKSTHESFREAPKNIILESAADLKKHAAVIYAQTVQGKAMPLGNQTDMTEAERAALGQWLKELP